METNEIEPSEDQFVEDVQGETNGFVKPEAVAATTETPKPITQSDMDAAFEKLGTAITKAVTPQQQREAVQEMSPAEVKKLWAIYDPEEGQKDFMRKWFRMNPEATEQDVTEARAMWKNMQEGLVRQAVVGSRNLMTVELDKMRKEYAKQFEPLQKFYQEAQAEKLSTEFFSAFPTLGELNDAGKPKYMKAIKIAADELAKQNFNSRPEYFQALAERAAEFVKGILPDFDLGKAANKNKTSTSTPRLPRTGAGGTGGTSREVEAAGAKVQRGANGDDSGTLDWTAAS